MEHLYSKIIGLPVIEIDTSRFVFLVRDIVIDPDNGQIVAFLINNSLIITPYDILTIKNGVWIKNAEDLSTVEDVVKVSRIVESFGSFFRKKVFTEDGKYLGKILDIYFNSHITHLTKIFVSKSLLGFIQYSQRVIPVKNIIETQKDAVIVKSDYAKAIDSVPAKVTLEGA